MSNELFKIYIRDGTIHLPPDSILSRYLGADTICIANYYYFFLRISILQVLRFDIAMLHFLFLTLDYGKKLNDTINIQTVTIKNPSHLSSHNCDPILQFIVIFVCLLKTRQWKIADYTLKRDCRLYMMSHINKNNASHLSKRFRSIHTVYI